MAESACSRRAVALASFIAALSFARVAAADGTVCGNAYVQGQRLRKEGRLVEARPELLVCARDPCPKVFQPECVEWLGDVEKRVPTVVFRARDARGEDVADVHVSVDGASIAGGMSGSAAEIDPGEHVLRFDREGYRPIERRVFIREGEKARLIDVQYEPPAQAPASVPPAPPDREAALWPVYVSGAVTVVGLVGLAVFGTRGVSEWNDLQSCNGHCAAADYDATRRDLRLADVALGVSIVGLAFTGGLLLFRSAATTKAARAATTPGGLRVSF